MTATTGALLLAAGGLTDVNLGLTIWTVILFALFSAILYKLGWKPILAMVEEREKRIVEAVESASKAQDEAQALLVQQKEILREAGQQRESMMKQAFADAEQVRANLMAQAKAEAERLIEKARDQIGREKDLAVRELRAQVADLAIDAASRIVKSSLTPDAQRQLVNEFLDSLPKQ